MSNLFAPSIKFRVTGFNQSRFLTEVAKSGVSVKKVARYSEKDMSFVIKTKDREKVFAIMDKMCYNITNEIPIGFYGLLISAIKNVGVTVGIIAFLLSSALPNFIISDVVIKGSGRVYQQDILDFLSANGVQKYALSFGKDFDAIANEALINNDGLTFVSIKKSGAQIIVTAIVKEDEPVRLKGDTFNLYSTVEGVVKDIKVYKGTAVVNVGDLVCDGDLLVTGAVDINGVTVSSNVYAMVTIDVKKSLEFFSENKDFEKELSLFIKSEYGDNAEYIITKKQEKNGYAYFVTVSKTVAIVAN